MPGVGSRLDLASDDVAKLGGIAIEIGPRRITLLADTPAPGAAFLASDNGSEFTLVSVRRCLYGLDDAAALERDDPLWCSWLDNGTPQTD